MLIALLNHADRVKLGCIAQVVNVIAPIMTATGGSAWRQTIFHPLAHASSFGRGTVLRPVVDAPTYDTKDRKAVPYLSLAAVTGGMAGGLTLFAVNRSLDQKLELKVDLRAFPDLKLAEWQVLRHRDLDAVNTEANPAT